MCTGDFPWNLIKKKFLEWSTSTKYHISSVIWKSFFFSDHCFSQNHRDFPKSTHCDWHCCYFLVQYLFQISDKVQVFLHLFLLSFSFTLRSTSWQLLFFLKLSFSDRDWWIVFIWVIIIIIIIIIPRINCRSYQVSYSSNDIGGRINRRSYTTVLLNLQTRLL